MKNLVSILIPAFNADKYIYSTIQSVLSQTWQKKEIIVVDDGSTDNTYNIARRFESNIMKVVRQENSGASSARNNALRIAQGDYIQWIDSDDILFYDKISKQMDVAKAMNNNKILYSSSFGSFYYRTNNAKFISTSIWSDQKPVDWIIRKFTENVWMFPAAWLIPRELITDAGIWDTRLSLDDDGEYACRLVSCSNIVKFVSASKCFYRIGNFGSLSQQRSKKALDSLALSTELSVETLLKLEDSPRTREACSKLVMRRFKNVFCPDRIDIFYRLMKFASRKNIFLEEEEIRKYMEKKSFFSKNIKSLKILNKKISVGFYRNMDKLLYDLKKQQNT
ncbi:glycosyltransferase family 2 protein [bacterium]|nr:glycosyltransferase family 2 protein [bacterium]